MGQLTTHVLDLTSGRPAAGMKVELIRFANDHGAMVVASEATNADGRIDGALLEGAQMARGYYELRFYAGDYLQATGAPVSEPPFLDIIPIRFAIADEKAHYHVPLLLSPHGYSTYRGS